MLDVDRLRRIRLRSRPLGQRLMAELFLRWDYLVPRRTEIVVEGIENLPQDRTVVLAMNHTDRYNYWPFQYRMYQLGGRYTATWVKGKYYETGLMGWFMDHTNNIPMPSRGYLLSVLFRADMRRPPRAEEYRWLRDRSEEVDCGPAPSPEAEAVAITLGGPDMPDEVDRRFEEMMMEVVRIHRQALDDERLHFLVFPEGTRKKRLGPGRVGMAQMAQHLGLPIVPVGCSGSDHVYAGAFPFASGGRIVYRVGQVLELDSPEFAPYRIKEPFIPFSRSANRCHGPAFRVITDVVMDRINGLVDARYQRDETVSQSNPEGTARFL